MVKNQVKKQKQKFADNKVVISLMLFLIKITYVKPILSMTFTRLFLQLFLLLYQLLDTKFGVLPLQS